MGTAKGKGGGRIPLEHFLGSGGIYLSLYFTMVWNTGGRRALASCMHTWTRSVGVSLARAHGTG
jgi:hypothetical protein